MRYEGSETSPATGQAEIDNLSLPVRDHGARALPETFTVRFHPAATCSSPCWSINSHLGWYGNLEVGLYGGEWYAYPSSCRDPDGRPAESFDTAQAAADYLIAAGGAQ
jgi:hypothetical protein